MANAKVLEHLRGLQAEKGNLIKAAQDAISITGSDGCKPTRMGILIGAIITNFTASPNCPYLNNRDF